MSKEDSKLKSDDAENLSSNLTRLRVVLVAVIIDVISAVLVLAVIRQGEFLQWGTTGFAIGATAYVIATREKATLSRMITYACVNAVVFAVGSFTVIGH